MIYFFLSILSATGLFVVFSFFARFGVDNFQAIVVNYFVAFVFGTFYAAGHDVPVLITGAEPWLWIAVLLGIIFVVNFQIMAVTSQINGVSITSVATKMSMVLPALFFILFDPDEGFTVFKAIGISLGIAAVVFSSARKEDTEKANQKALFPLILFLLSGFLDLILAYAEKSYLASESAYLSFVPIPFAVATFSGAIVLIVQVFRKRQILNLRSVIGGLILGFVNYGSIYFFLKLLGSGVMDRSSAIPANSMGTVALSALLGLVIFRERLSAKNRFGIVLALIAILFLIPFG